MKETGHSLEQINVELKDLIGAYNKYKSAHDNSDRKDNKQLYLLRAGKSFESLVDYIVKREKLIVKPRNKAIKYDESYEPTLDDCIHALKINKIVKDDAIIRDFHNIKNWRNPNVHRDKTTNVANVNLIRDSTVESVYDSFKEVLTWFFEVYLNNEFADFSNNIYTNSTKTKEPTIEELEEIKRNFEKNPLNIPDFSILTQSKKAPKPRNKNIVLKYFILIIALSIVGYYLYNEYYKENGNVTNVKTKLHLNKDQVLEVIRNFQDSYNDVKFDAHEYFANHVDHYITDPNINNPTQIEIARKTNVEYIDPKSTIDPESLVLISKNDSVSYWQFSGESVCFRKSKNKFQKCNVVMEYGINTDGKITRIKQINYTNLKYTKNRPN